LRGITRILGFSNPEMYQGIGLPDSALDKLHLVTSIADLPVTLRKERVTAIFCSNFGKKYARLIHFRNINQLNCPVFGITHPLSYQDEVGALYRLYCAGVRKWTASCARQLQPSR
jgi:hypothetical protein